MEESKSERGFVFNRGTSSFFVFTQRGIAQITTQSLRIGIAGGRQADLGDSLLVELSDVELPPSEDDAPIRTFDFFVEKYKLIEPSDDFKIIVDRRQKVTVSCIVNYYGNSLQNRALFHHRFIGDILDYKGLIEEPSKVVDYTVIIQRILLKDNTGKFVIKSVVSPSPKQESSLQLKSLRKSNMLNRNWVEDGFIKGLVCRYFQSFIVWTVHGAAILDRELSSINGQKPSLSTLGQWIWLKVRESSRPVTTCQETYRHIVTEYEETTNVCDDMQFVKETNFITAECLVRIRDKRIGTFYVYQNNVFSRIDDDKRRIKTPTPDTAYRVILRNYPTVKDADNCMYLRWVIHKCLGIETGYKWPESEQRTESNNLCRKPIDAVPNYQDPSSHYVQCLGGGFDDDTASPMPFLEDQERGSIYYSRRDQRNDEDNYRAESFDTPDGHQSVFARSSQTRHADETFDDQKCFSYSVSKPIPDYDCDAEDVVADNTESEGDISSPHSFQNGVADEEYQKTVKELNECNIFLRRLFANIKIRNAIQQEDDKLFNDILDKLV